MKCSKLVKSIRSTSDELPMGISIYDAQANLVYMNKAAVSLFELSNADDAIGFELFEDPNIPIETKEMIRLNDTFEFEIDFNFKSAQLHNSYMHGELSNKYLYIKGIKGYDKYALSYYMFTIEDRTTEKQLEAAFSNKNEQLSRAMEVGEVAVWDWKLDTNDVFISENFYDWFDTDYHFLEEQFMTILDYVHPQEQLQVSEQFRKTIQNQENNLEVVFRLRKNQNAYVWVRMLGEAVYADNNLYRFTGIFLNIDIRKRASDSLTEKDRSMNILLDNMETAFAVHDMVYDESGDAIDYRFVYVNRAYEELLGVKKEHMVGHTMAGLYPNFEKRVIQAYGNVARYGQSFRFSDYIGLRQRYCDAIVYQTKRDQFAVLYNDITEKRLIEEALKQTEKMSALGQLAGGIAHDFNNQLMIMSSFCQLLMDMELSNVEKGYIDKIYNATTHSKEIIKELLAFSKKGSANYITINFNHLVERVIQIMRFTFDKNITITSELVSLTANVYGDESLLENALINLCINAKDALNSSGSNNNYIKINTQNMMINEPKHLVIDVLQPGHYVVVKISDNGMGIKPENINKIFEPFFTTKDQRGTGMGLAAVFGTVKRHSGGIDIQSVFGEGTVVSVYIPVSDEVIEESKHSLHNVSETKKEREILIIDDEPIICEVLKEYFSAKKYKVHTANMPSKGLEIYREIHDQIEVVLLDVIMPEMNGFEVLSELITINNSTRAIILSGYREDISLSKEVESHILTFIEKPVNLNSLYETIEEFLG